MILNALRDVSVGLGFRDIGRDLALARKTITEKEERVGRKQTDFYISLSLSLSLSLKTYAYE